MPEIRVTRQADETMLNHLGVREWPIWTKEVSTFPWIYEAQETCYFLEGQVVVIPDGGRPVSMGQGDLVTFPKGMSCIWKVELPVKKHYRFGS